MDPENQEESVDAGGAISKKSNLSNAEKKWGRQVIKSGFCIVPSILLKAQARLELSPAQLAVLLHIADHWWDAAAKPFPGKAELAKRLSVTERQIQRIVADLEKAGLVRREERYSTNQGRLSNFYHLDGLVKKLQELEPEFRQIKEQARKAHKEATSRKPPSVKRVSAKASAA